MSWNYLAGLMCFCLSACVMKNPTLLFLKSSDVDSYPSGSTISHFNGKFYVMGDDASEMLVLNKDQEVIERIQIFDKGEELRAPKALKADIESSVIINNQQNPSVLFLGSGSVSPHRDSAFILDLHTKEVSRINMKSFYDELRTEFKDLNIEAAAIIDENLLLGIRANTRFKDNYIALANMDGSSFTYKRKIIIKLPLNNTGISGMDYDGNEDILFITFSSENTANSFDDGEIGESFLAIIPGASQDILKKEVHITKIFKLSDLSPEFQGQKIESVSLTANKRELLLVADNDQGLTKLFKIQF